MGNVQTLRIDGQQVACCVEGPRDAPAVLLVHGILTDHRIWDAVAARLVPRFRVVRYDLPGHGGSSARPGPSTLAQLADQIPPLLDALGIGRVHFIGSSLGGMIGQQVGARHGARLLTLTLANTAAVQAAPAAWEDRVAIARGKGVDALADATLQRWFTAGFQAAQPAEMERVKSLLLGTSVEGFASCAVAVRDLAHLDLLPRISVPTLVVAGNQDGATPPEMGRQIAGLVPEARLVTLDAGHQCAAELPQVFCEAWQSFVLASLRN